MHDRPAQLAELLTGRLADSGVRFRIHEHVVSRTVADAEALLPFPLAGLLKTVVFRVKGGPWVLAVCRGQDRVDYRKLALACEVKRADLVRPAPEEVEAALGFAIGGVSPLPPDDTTRSIVDATAATTLDTVYCGIGRNDQTLEIAIADLIAVAGARVLPIVQ
jgi:Cys-tRNA(Pro)/Cys-tRNA(Cys) deacylase